MKVDANQHPLPPSGPQTPAGSHGAAAVNLAESAGASVARNATQSETERAAESNGSNGGIGGFSPHANVRLSANAMSLRAAAADSSGDINTARVEALRTAIAKGTYRPDPAKIADGMLQSSQDLIKKPSS